MSTRYGERLRELRAERQLSLREVEERGGPNKDTMSLAERGVHKPHPQTIGRIAKAFGMSVSALNAELEEADDPKVLRPQSLEELLHRSGVESRWLTLGSEEFSGWWLGIDRKEVIRRYRQIRAEYKVIADEWSAIHKGESTVAPVLQSEIRQRMHEFFARHLGAAAAAPGQGETEAEFYERQSNGAYRQFKQVDLEAVEKDLKKIVPRAG